MRNNRYKLSFLYQSESQVLKIKPGEVSRPTSSRVSFFALKLIPMSQTYPVTTIGAFGLASAYV